MSRGFTRTLQRAAARNAGVPLSRAGLNVAIEGRGGRFSVVYTFTGMLIPVTDALAYASAKLFDFADGKIRHIGGTSKLRFKVTTARTTINDSAAMDYSLGTAAASSITLASTMVDILAKQDHTLDGVADAYTAFQAADLAAAATFDGTGTAKDLYLNVGFPTNTEIDADGTLAVDGVITHLFEQWGDNA